MEANTLSLFEVSAKLGVSPSAIKKRVANLNLPVQRGARSKLIFDERAFSLLLQADELLKAGHGFEECRRRLGLEAVEGEGEAVEATLMEAEPAAIAPEPEAEPEVLEIVVPAAEVAPEEEEEAAPEPVAEPVGASEPEPGTESDDDGPLRPLPPPVFIQLGRRKAEAAAASAAATPTATAAPVAESPELISRLDRTLKLIEEKEKQNQQLQAKLLVAYDEMTKLSATAAAFQERSLNLQHEVTKLQSELRLLTAPASSKPWWKFWA